MTHPYLVQAIAAAQPPDNDLRVGTVVANDGGAVRVDINSGIVDCGYLRSYVPAVEDTVAVLRQEAGWLVLGSIGGPASPAGEDAGASTGTGIVGEAYFSGGTATTAAAGAENIMTAWTGGGTFTFQAGQLYRWNLAFGFYDSAGTAHLCEIRLRKGFTTAGLQLAQFRRVTVAGVGASIVQMGQHSGFIKNATGGEVTTPVGVSIQRSAGTGSVALYGDATFQMILTLERIGPTSSYATLSAIAVEIN